MPLFHIGGGGWATAGMYEGCTSVIFRELDPAALIALIEKERISHAFLVPAVLQFMLMVPGVQDADYSSLKVFVYGASPISEEVLAKCVEMFKPCKFWQAYGLTETTGAIVNLPPEDHDPNGPNKHRLRSCGVAGPGVELRIVGEDGEAALPAGEVGEIWIRSPQVMTGYWRMPEETAKAVTARWMVQVGRCRLPRRRRVPLHPRSGQGHDRVGRRERVPGGGGERADEARGDRRRRGHRRSAREVGGDGQGHRGRGARCGPGRRTPKPRSSRSRSRSWRRSSARPASTGSTSCPATRRARSSRRTSASPTGKAWTAESADPGQLRRRLRSNSSVPGGTFVVTALRSNDLITAQLRWLRYLRSVFVAEPPTIDRRRPIASLRDFFGHPLQAR